MHSQSPLPAVSMFVAVVDHGSFTAAAGALGVSKSYASKQVRALEDQLGAKLLNRSTRRLSLTDVGRSFYERCSAALDELQAAQLAVGEVKTSARGSLRVSAPMSFGVRWLAPLLAEYAKAHGELTVDCVYSDRRVDIVEEGFDLAVRIGRGPDSALIGKKIAPTYKIPVASPEYIAQHGMPCHPKELANHECMEYAYLTTGQDWRFRNAEEEVSVRTQGRMRMNNGNAMLEAARAGVGIALLPDFFCTKALANGELVRVVDQWTTGVDFVWAVYPHSRHLSAKVWLFVELLRERLTSPIPWLSQQDDWSDDSLVG